MKKLLEWTNSTEKFKSGVCEAATMLWLARLDHGGLEEALKLKPEHCDELQAAVESGKSTFATALEPMLALESSFKPFEDVPITVASFAALEIGDFLYLSVSSGAQGHAVTVYRHRNGVFFFNPGEGIYYSRSTDAELKELDKLIREDSHFGSQSAARKGSLRGAGYKLDRFFGG